MQTATLLVTNSVADRILAFGASLPSRQAEIVSQMVSKGKARLASLTPSTAVSLTAGEASQILNEKAKSLSDNDSAWTFDIWKHSI